MRRPRDGLKIGGWYFTSSGVIKLSGVNYVAK